MQTHAPIQSQPQKFHVVTQSDACAHCQFLEDIPQLELSTGAITVTVQCPHITRIHESGTIEVVKDSEPVFEIGLKLDVACLVKV